MSKEINVQSMAARLLIDKVIKTVTKLPITNEEKRDTFLYGAVIMSAAWRLYAPMNTGDLLIGFPFVGEDQQSAVADVPQELLDEMTKWLKLTDGR